MPAAPDPTDVSSIEVAQADPELIDQIPDEVWDELPEGTLEDLLDGTIDQIPTEEISQLPDDLADSVPDALVGAASSNPLLAVVLVVVGLLALPGAIWSLVKGLIKFAVLLVVVGVAAWFWFFNR